MSSDRGAGRQAGAPAVARRQMCWTTMSCAYPSGLKSFRCWRRRVSEAHWCRASFCPAYASWVEFSARWQMGASTHPEATYLLYPFNLPGATARFDLGGQAIRPEADQIAGVCRDYFTVQNWVDFNDGKAGVMIATPDNPLMQLGDFHFGHNQATFSLERAMLLGWVTNTYWETNFRPQQAGPGHGALSCPAVCRCVRRSADASLWSGCGCRHPLAATSGRAHGADPVAGQCVLAYPPPGRGNYTARQTGLRRSTFSCACSMPAM